MPHLGERDTSHLYRQFKHTIRRGRLMDKKRGGDQPHQIGGLSHRQRSGKARYDSSDITLKTLFSEGLIYRSGGVAPARGGHVRMRKVVANPHFRQRRQWMPGSYHADKAIANSV